MTPTHTALAEGELAEQRQRPTPATAPRDHRIASVLAIQQSAGNQAVARSMAARTGASDVPRAAAPLPGGTSTKPLPTMRSAPTPTAAGPDPSSIPVPSAVARSAPALGGLMQLVGAAQRAADATRPEPARDAIPAAAAQAVAALGGGEPVPAEARAPFEQAYGYALDPVRLHRGPVAARAAASLGAHAVALGDHILLGTGADVSSHAGRMILGHELAHVVQARRHPMAGIGRVSRASDASEVEATSAALRALRGESTDLVESASDDPQLLAWWVLALIGLGIGAVVAGTAAATGHGVDENRAAHTHANRGTGQDVLAWIPIAGSVQDIWEAESNLQLAFGIGFLAFDCATLGGTGMLVRGLARVPGAALRVLAAGGERAAAESAAHGVLRVAGEEVTEQALQQATHQLAERGGAVSAATATEEISRALARDGAMVFATEGAHAVMYANRAGQIVKVHGGPLIVRVTSELGENAAEVATRAVSGAESREGAMTAYVVLEGGAPLTLQALERMPTGVAGIAEAAGRNIVGSPTSCGILQGAALEASGLSAEAAARLIPSGGGSGRYFPVTLVDHWIASGEGRLIEGGAAQLVYGAAGTVPQAAFALTLGVGGRSAVPVVARRTAMAAAAPDPAIAATFERASVSIVDRWGRTPDAAAIAEIRAALPGLIPGWMLLTPETRAALANPLQRGGMSAETAASIAQ